MDEWLRLVPHEETKTNRQMQERKYENIIINNFYFYYRSFISNNLT